MKLICNAMQEGRCKGEIGKCNHRRRHSEWEICRAETDVLCTEERFCKIQQEMVQCIEVSSFPAMKNPVTVSDELAREFVEWARVFTCNRADSHVCNRLTARLKEQLK